MTEQEDKATLSDLGARVRAWRARRGMTRKQLAADSGLSERFLADVHTGGRNWRGSAACRLWNWTARSSAKPAPA